MSSFILPGVVIEIRWRQSELLALQSMMEPSEYDDRAVREKIEADREADFYREEEASPVDYEEEEEG